MSEDNTQRPWTHLIRLKNGDDVVAQIVEMKHDDIEEIMLFYPMKIVYSASDSGYSIGMMPWVFYKICDKQEFTVNKNDILFYQEVEASMNESYWSAVDRLEKSMEEELIPEADEQELLDEMMDYIQGLDKRTFH